MTWSMCCRIRAKWSFRSAHDARKVEPNVTATLSVNGLTAPRDGLSGRYPGSADAARGLSSRSWCWRPYMTELDTVRPLDGCA